MLSRSCQSAIERGVWLQHAKGEGRATYAILIKRSLCCRVSVECYCEYFVCSCTAVQLQPPCTRRRLQRSSPRWWRGLRTSNPPALAPRLTLGPLRTWLFVLWRMDTLGCDPYFRARKKITLVSVVTTRVSTHQSIQVSVLYTRAPPQGHHTSWSTGT